MIDERNLDTRIEIDGGIGLSNIAEVVRAGAESLLRVRLYSVADDRPKLSEN
jgi:pentose-5-phosphate-3-epimerase